METPTLPEKYPVCDRLKELLKSKGWDSQKLVMLLHLRFQRKYIQADGRVPVDERLINQAKRGEILLPDTLRANITAIMGGTQKDVFPEYAIACDRLRQERANRGWTQREVADRCKKLGRRMRPHEISALECGSKYPHESTRQVIAKVFEMSEVELFPEFFDHV